MEVEQFPCCPVPGAVVLTEDNPMDVQMEEMETNESRLNMKGCTKLMEEETVEYSSLPRPETLKDLIDGLHLIFDKDKVNVDMVKTYMNLYKSNPREWKKYAKWDEHRYTRNLVDAGNGKFNLMVLCWHEAQGSSIHSHANSHCFMKVLDGSVQEALYDWPKPDQNMQMHQREVNKYERNQTAYISDSIGLHRVENPSHTDKAVTLHLYSPPFDECDSFDEKTGHKNSVKVTFWSKFGHRTPFGRTGCNEPENN